MERSSELEAVVRRIWKAFIERDADTLRNLTTDHPDMRIIMSDDDEWIRPKGRFAEIATDRAERMGAAGIDFDRFEAFEHEGTGWWAANMIVTFADRDPLTFRQTGVAVIEAGVWRAAQIHTSIGVPNAESFGYEISTGLADLVDSLDDETSETVVTASQSGTVTLMFTDLENSTVVSESMGDSAWSRLITGHFEALHRIVALSGGTVIKTLGDGAMIAFASVRDAIGAAIGIQRAMATSDPKVRIGIHTGDAVRSSGDYAGIAVNKAARIASAASGGEILASSVTAELAGNEFRFGPSRVGELKGLSGTHHLIPVLPD